jgi:riboflavin transporter FmnP
MTKELTVSKSDFVLIIAGVIGAIIVALSLYAFFFSPLYESGATFPKDKAAAFKELFDVVVKGTLLPLFTTLITAKIGYQIAKVLLDKFSDR